MRAAMLLLPFAGLLQASTIYSVTDLGAMGGSSTVAFGINSSGIAVGWGEALTGDMGAFLSGSGGSMQNLAGLAGGTDTYAYGINSAGTVVGTSYVNGQPHGEIWNGAKSTDLGSGIFATGINDAGVVIGGNGVGNVEIVDRIDRQSHRELQRPGVRILRPGPNHQVEQVRRLQRDRLRVLVHLVMRLR